MADHDLLELLDSSNELKGLVKARKWSVVVDLCEKKLKKSDAHNALQVQNGYTCTYTLRNIPRDTYTDIHRFVRLSQSYSISGLARKH